MHFEPSASMLPVNRQAESTGWQSEYIGSCADPAHVPCEPSLSRFLGDCVTSCLAHMQALVNHGTQKGCMGALCEKMTDACWGVLEQRRIGIHRMQCCCTCLGATFCCGEEHALARSCAAVRLM